MADAEQKPASLPDLDGDPGQGAPESLEENPPSRAPMRLRTRSILIMLIRGLALTAAIVQMAILTRIITKESLGTFKQVQLTYAVLTSLLAIELASSMFYFIPRVGLKGRRSFLLQTICISYVSALLRAGLMFFAAYPIAMFLKNPDLAPFLRIFAIYPFMRATIDLVPSFLISLDRTVFAMLYNAAEIILRVTSTVIAFWAGLGVVGALWVILTIEAVCLVAAILIISRHSGSGIPSPSKKLVWEQLGYVWPLAATSIVHVLYTQLDKVVISRFFDSAIYAVYVVGAVEIPVATLVTNSIGMAILPALISLSMKGRSQDAINLWHEAVRKCSLVIFAAFAIFVVISGDFVLFMYGEPYAAAIWPFRIFLLLMLLRIGGYATIMRALGKTRAIAVSLLVGMIVNISLCLFLAVLGKGGFLSFIGPAISAVCATLSASLYLLWAMRAAFSIPFSAVMRWRELGKILAVCLVCAVPAGILPLGELTPIVAILVRGGLAGIIMITGLWKLILTADEKNMLLGPWRLLVKAVRRGRSS